MVIGLGWPELELQPGHQLKSLLKQTDCGRISVISVIIY